MYAHNSYYIVVFGNGIGVFQIEIVAAQFIHITDKARKPVFSVAFICFCIRNQHTQVKCSFFTVIHSSHNAVVRDYLKNSADKLADA